MKIKFHHREDLTEHISTYSFVKPTSYYYIAGQFIELKLPHQADDRGEKRWFTLSSAPHDEYLSITTKHSLPSSSFKKTLHDLKSGDLVGISEPMGDFVLPRDTTKPLLFVAGGIGITPFLSILSEVAHQGKTRDITLIYSATNKTEFIHRKLLQEQCTANFTTERITPDSVRAIASKLSSPTVYMSGPEPMIESLYQSLKDNFTQSQLLTDYFPNYK